MENKEIVRNFVEEVWNQNNPDAVEKYVDPNFIVHLLGGKKGGEGIEWVKTNVTKAHNNFLNLHIEIEDMVSEGNRIVSRLLLSATRGGVETTSREFMLHVIKDGKFIEAWSLGSQWD